MAKKAKIRLRPGSSIGAPAAEEDHAYLNACFVDLPAVDVLKDISSPNCLLVGRTGAGKSAILWHLETSLQNVTRIDPKEVAFQYLGNSAIIHQLTELGTDLHSLYEYLWKHVLTLHIIQECMQVHSTDNLRARFLRIRDYLKLDRKRELVFDYLNKHGNSFWLGVEQVSAEFTSLASEKLGADVGLSGAAFKAKIEAGGQFEEHEKRTLKYRAQEIVSSLQIRQLNETIDLLSGVLEQNQCNYYILIDDLDKDWAGNEQSQYALIRALIECLKSFRRISNLKIIVALREDVYEATLRSTTDKHFQPEKHEGFITRLRWSREQLVSVVEQRIRQLFVSKYTKQGVKLEDVLPSTVVQEGTRGYLVEHTLRRPRDIIAFVNKLLLANEGEALPLPSRAITKTEPTHSRDRMSALEVEWRSCHPLIKSYLSALKGLVGPTEVRALDEERMFELLISTLDLNRKPIDAIERLGSTVYDRDKESKLRALARSLVACLFKVGAIGVKLRSDKAYTFCYDEHSTIEDTEISDATKFVVHPMLVSALGGRPEQSEAAA